MALARLLAPLLALSLAACEEGTQLAVFQVQIIDATGELPVDEGQLTVTVAQNGQTLDCDDGPCTSEIRDGDFMLDLPLMSFEAMTEIRLEIDGDGERWIGATPPFQPYGEGFDEYPVVRAVVGRPASCEVLELDGPVSGDPPALDPPRSRAAAVVRRNLVLLAGGEQLDGDADDHVTNFDQLLFDTVPWQTWNDPVEIGAARGLALSEDVSLVVGDRASFLFERSATSAARPKEIDLHAGAGYASAVVSLGRNGGAVIGGRESDGITWLSAQGAADATSDRLAVARTAPAAALLDGGILVVGGHSAGEAGAEWVPLPGDGRALPDLALPDASGGVLFPSPDGSAALWIGYEEGGVTSAETVIVRCDGGACAAEAGPEWTRARSSFAPVITAEGTLWLLGGAEDAGAWVDLVRWEGGAPRIDDGPDLPGPTADAVAFEHEAGVVTVAGGKGRGEIVMCFPRALDPL